MWLYKRSSMWGMNYTFHMPVSRCLWNNIDVFKMSRKFYMKAQYVHIPANFFWDISVRLLSRECWDFWMRHDHFRRFPKKSEVFRRNPKSSEDVWSLMTCINTRSLQVRFTSKIRDHGEGIVIYSFYTWFSFLTWVWATYVWKLCQPRRQQLTF